MSGKVINRICRLVRFQYCRWMRVSKMEARIELGYRRNRLVNSRDHRSQVTSNPSSRSCWYKKITMKSLSAQKQQKQKEQICHRNSMSINIGKKNKTDNLHQINFNRSKCQSCILDKIRNYTKTHMMKPKAKMNVTIHPKSQSSRKGNGPTYKRFLNSIQTSRTLVCTRLSRCWKITANL